ncbi:MAG: methyltransferase domain-containing protein [Congregibacter sp.]
MHKEMPASDWAGDRGKKWVEHMAATEVMLSPIDAPLIEALNLQDGCLVADIGCGGGRTTRAIAQRLDSESQVAGIDVSPDVIAAAKSSRAEQSDADTVGAKIEFHCVDAASGRPALAPFDRLGSRFGVMFFEDPPAAFANLRSWLNPGGQFAFAVWGPLPQNAWIACLRQVIANLVELPKPPPDAPGPFRYADADRFCQLLETAGFSNLSVAPWQGELALGGGMDAKTAAAFCLSAFSVGDLVGDDPALLHRAEADLAECLVEYEQGGVVRMPSAVNIVSGRRA